MRRFLAGFGIGWGIGLVVYVALDAMGIAWEGLGLVGVGVGLLAGWVNVARRDQRWSEYLRRELRDFW